MYFNKEHIANLSKIKRLNLINSITGIKPGNLIGTRSNDLKSNLAVISSVVHLGSKPPYIGFILRPSETVRRDTYENILENKFFTINHIHEDFIQNAHYTSAKFDKDISEFESCHLSEEYLDDFHAPYVKESSLKIGLLHVESIPIPINQTLMIVGEVVHVHTPEDSLSDEGFIQLDQIKSAGIGGLNSYYKLEKIQDFPYARVEELPNFKNEKK